MLESDGVVVKGMSLTTNKRKFSAAVNKQINTSSINPIVERFAVRGKPIHSRKKVINCIVVEQKDKNRIGKHQHHKPSAQQ